MAYRTWLIFTLLLLISSISGVVTTVLYNNAVDQKEDAADFLVPMTASWTVVGCLAVLGALLFYNETKRATKSSFASNLTRGAGHDEYQELDVLNPNDNLIQTSAQVYSAIDSYGTPQLRGPPTTPSRSNQRQRSTYRASPAVRNDSNATLSSPDTQTSPQSPFDNHAHPLMSSPTRSPVIFTHSPPASAPAAVFRNATPRQGLQIVRAEGGDPQTSAYVNAHRDLPHATHPLHNGPLPSRNGQWMAPTTGLTRVPIQGSQSSERRRDMTRQ